MTAELRPKVSTADCLRSVVTRLPMFAFLWWTLTEGAADGLWAGMVAVPAALLVSVRVWRPGPSAVPLSALASFAGFFLWQSLRGGLAVARLALRPHMRLRPGLRQLSLCLPPQRGRVLLANTISLLPGTLSVGLEGDTLQVHVLDERLVTDTELQRTQERVARLVGAA